MGSNPNRPRQFYMQTEPERFWARLLSDAYWKVFASIATVCAIGLVVVLLHIEDMWNSVNQIVQIDVKNYPLYGGVAKLAKAEDRNSSIDGPNPPSTSILYAVIA